MVGQTTMYGSCSDRGIEVVRSKEGSVVPAERTIHTVRTETKREVIALTVFGRIALGRSFTITPNIRMLPWDE